MSRPSKILLLANDASTLWLFRRELLQRLIHEGFEVVCALPSGYLDAEFKRMGCTVRALSVDRRGLNPLKDTAFFFACLKKRNDSYYNCVCNTNG